MKKYTIETQKLSKDKSIRFMRAGKAYGKRYLLTQGWKQSKNPNFMNRNDEYTHYNSIMKVWLFE